MKTMTMAALFGAALVGMCAGAAVREPTVRLDIRDGVTQRARFDPTNAFSVALWVKPETIPHLVRSSRVCGVGDAWFDGFGLSVSSRSDGTYWPKLSFGMRTAVAIDGRDQGGEKLIKHVTAKGEGVRAQPGKWVHFAGTWDGRTLRVYADGRLCGQDDTIAPYEHPKNPLLEAGAECGVHAAHPFPHLSDQVAAWDVELTPEEIAELASRRPALPETVEFARLLDRGLGPEPVRAKELLALRPASLSSKGQIALAGALAFGYLLDGDLAKAREQAALYERPLAASVYSRLSGEMFHFRFADALVAHGFLDEGLGEFRRYYEGATGEWGRVWLPVAAKEYAKVLQKAGRGAEARKVMADALAANPEPYFYGQVAAEEGRSVNYTARPQGGARVSRAQPKSAFYVSPDGDDAADGSAASPFRTLVRARDAVRALKAAKGLPEGGVAVHLLDGTYYLGDSIELGERDSGERDRPVVWDAAPGARAVVSGGWAVPALAKPGAADAAVLARVPETARPRVRVADIRGFPHYKDPYPRLFVANARYSDDTKTDLFLNGRLLTPARSPNEGEGYYGVTELGGKIRQGGYGNLLTRGPIYCKDVPDLEKWAKEKEVVWNGAAFLGYQHFAFPVRSIDPADGKFDVDSFTDIARRASFFLQNSPLALDAPGEWWIDRAAGRLYVVVDETDAGDGKGYVLSSLNKPLLRFNDVHDFRLEGLVVEQGSRDGLAFSNCTDVVLSGDVVRNFGVNGIVGLDIRHFTLSDSVLHDIGAAALTLQGGDRRLLVSDEIKVANNDFFRPGRRFRCSTCLGASGIGYEISGNRFHDMRSSALRLEGNDMWIVSNRFDHCVLEVEDEGVTDIYGNASYAGVRYCWNVFEDCGHAPTHPTFCGSAHPMRFGIRWDGAICGQVAYANRFTRVGDDEQGAVQSCGGRYNVVDNNVFEDCHVGFSCGVWNQKYWANDVCRRAWFTNLVLNASAPWESQPHYARRTVDIRSDVYRRRYPYMADLLASPQYYAVTRNVVIGDAPVTYSYAAPIACLYNRLFATEPDWAKLERETGFAHVPTADEVGPRPTEALRRAKENDR